MRCLSIGGIKVGTYPSYVSSGSKGNYEEEESRSNRKTSIVKETPTPATTSLKNIVSLLEKIQLQEGIVAKNEEELEKSKKELDRKKRELQSALANLDPETKEMINILAENSNNIITKRK